MVAERLRELPRTELFTRLFDSELEVLDARGIPYELREVALPTTRTPAEVLFVPDAGRAVVVWRGLIEATDAADWAEVLRRLDAWELTG